VTGNEASFISINLAYEVLSDESKKEAYDKLIKKTQSSAESSKKYTFSAKEEFSKQSNQKTYESNKKQQDKEEKNFSSTGNASSWSGGLFKQKNGLNSMQGNNPSDAFYMMMRFSVLSSGVLVWAYIIYLTIFAPYPKKKFEKPEGIETRLPERAAARKYEEVKDN
jgi:curved DNA-binding protein CbpA